MIIIAFSASTIFSLVIYSIFLLFLWFPLDFEANSMFFLLIVYFQDLYIEDLQLFG